MTIIVYCDNCLVADRLITAGVNRTKDKIKTGRYKDFTYYLALAGSVADVEFNSKIIIQYLKNSMSRDYIDGLVFSDHTVTGDMEFGILILKHNTHGINYIYNIFANGTIEDISDNYFHAIGIESAQTYISGFMDALLPFEESKIETVPRLAQAVLSAQNRVNYIGKGCTFVDLISGEKTEYI